MSELRKVYRLVGEKLNELDKTCFKDGVSYFLQDTGIKDGSEVRGYINSKLGEGQVSYELQILVIEGEVTYCWSVDTIPPSISEVLIVIDEENKELRK